MMKAVAIGKPMSKLLPIERLNSVSSCFDRDLENVGARRLDVSREMQAYHRYRRLLCSPNYQV